MSLIVSSRERVGDRVSRRDGEDINCRVRPLKLRRRTSPRCPNAREFHAGSGGGEQAVAISYSSKRKSRGGVPESMPMLTSPSSASETRR